MRKLYEQPLAEMIRISDDVMAVSGDLFDAGNLTKDTFEENW